MQSLHGHGEGASPVLYADTLIINWDHEGGSFVAALDKRTGRQLWRTGKDQPGPFRLDGISEVYSSPVGAADRVYVTDRDGTTLVISHADKPRILATNRLDESFSSSAALAGVDLFLRGQRFLYRLAEDD